MSKSIYCEDCGILVGKLATIDTTGEKTMIRKNTVHLCGDCYGKDKKDSYLGNNFFNDIFGSGKFGGKR